MEGMTPTTPLIMTKVEPHTAVTVMRARAGTVRLSARGRAWDTSTSARRTVRRYAAHLAGSQGPGRPVPPHHRETVPDRP